MIKNFSIRACKNDNQDLELLTQFCHSLTEYDGYTSTATVEKFKKSFARGNKIMAYFACFDEQPIGFIMFYDTFSCYDAEHILYVTGAYIEPEHRGGGYGTELFKFLAQYGHDHEYDHIGWIVEQNNIRSQEFYERLGAKLYKGWHIVRLEHDKIKALAQKA